MRLKTFIFMILVACSLIACNDDNNKATETVFNGSVEFIVNGKSSGTTDLQVKVTPIKKDLVQLRLINNQEGAGKMSIKDITITDVTMTKENEDTILNKNIPAEGIQVKDKGTETNWNITELSGNIKGNNMNLNLTGQPGKMPFSMDIIFKGSK